MIGSEPNTPKKRGRPFGKKPARMRTDIPEVIEANKVKEEALKRARSLKDELEKKKAVSNQLNETLDEEGLYKPPTLAKDKMIPNPIQLPRDEFSDIKPEEGVRLASEATITAEEYNRMVKSVNQKVPDVKLPGVPSSEPEGMSIQQYEALRKQALQPVPVSKAQHQEVVKDLVNSNLPNNSKKIILGLVSYKDVSPVTAIALFSTVQKLGDRVGIEWHFGDAIIENARNHVADLFMKREGAEWLLFLDDDVVPPFGRPDVTKRLCRLPDNYVERDCFWVDELLSANKSLVGGMYFGRSVEGRPMYAEACFQSSLTENQIARNTNVITCKPTDWVATGCMLIHRSVFESIQSNFPELAPSRKIYTTSLGTQVEYETKTWGYFNKIDPSQGEDVSFCHRAQMVGHQPHIHLGVRCQHIGMQAWNYMNVKGGMVEAPTVQPANGGLLRKVV